MFTRSSASRQETWSYQCCIARKESAKKTKEQSARDPKPSIRVRKENRARKIYNLHSLLHRNRSPVIDLSRPRVIKQVLHRRRGSHDSPNGVGELSKERSVLRGVKDVQEGLVREWRVGDCETEVGRSGGDERLDVEVRDVADVDETSRGGGRVYVFFASLKRRKRRVRSRLAGEKGRGWDDSR